MSVVKRAFESLSRQLECAAGPAELPARQRLYSAFALCFGSAFLVSLPFNVLLDYPALQQGLALATVLLTLVTYLSQRFDKAARLTASLSPYATLALLAAFTLVTGGMGGAMSFALSFLVVFLIVMPVGKRFAFLLTHFFTVVALAVVQVLRPGWILSPYASEAERLTDVAFTIVMAVGGLSMALLYLESRVRMRTEQLEAANRALTEQSLTDPLTGLHNRRYLQDALAEDLALLRRRWRDQQPERRGWALLMVDLDHFKHINDRHGHLAGDQVLAHAARLISQTVRRSDIVVRWGGEEFLIVARGLEADGAAVLAERLRTGFADAVCRGSDGVELRVTCSIGVAPYQLFDGALDAISWDAHLSLADHAMYEAKRSGRNSSCFVSARAQARPGDVWPATAPELIAAGLVEVTLSAPLARPPAAAG